MSTRHFESGLNLEPSCSVVVSWVSCNETLSETLSTMRLMASTRLDFSLPLGRSFLDGNYTNVLDSSLSLNASSSSSGTWPFRIEFRFFGGGFEPSVGDSTLYFGC